MTPRLLCPSRLHPELGSIRMWSRVQQLVYDSLSPVYYRERFKGSSSSTNPSRLLPSISRRRKKAYPDLDASREWRVLFTRPRDPGTENGPKQRLRTWIPLVGEKRTYHTPTCSFPVDLEIEETPPYKGGFCEVSRHHQDTWTQYSHTFPLLRSGLDRSLPCRKFINGPTGIGGPLNYGQCGANTDLSTMTASLNESEFWTVSQIRT